MSKNYLAEAFKEMDLLENSGSFTFDKTGAAKLGNFMEDDTLNDFETVIDPEATTEDELQDSYIGMGIVGCDVCHSLVYKPIEDIIIDEETQLANVGELCPYCFSGDGFKIVGKVAPFEDITVETDGDAEVKVDGKVINTDTDPETEEDREIVAEEIESAQKFPVESPVGEVREDLQEAPKKKWTRVTEEVESLKEGMEDILALDDFLTFYDSELLHKENEDKIKSQIDRIFKEEGCPEDLYADECYEMISDKAKAKISKIVKEYRKSNLTEGMEDISITTDDTVIKVKATPREDKETIVPVAPEEIEGTQSTEEVPVEEPAPTEGEEEMTDVEIDEIDEAGFDELGESYLKKVYENVQSYKTVSGSLRGNKIKLEGLITFNSGKKAKTNFIFEAKEMTKKGKVKFIGENLNLTKNKKAFTLTGRTEGKKLVCENFNYNYLAKDGKSGASKRLYGTVKVK